MLSAAQPESQDWLVANVKPRLNNEGMPSALHQRLLNLRKSTGLSQEAFGAEFGVSKSAVSQWESPDPKHRTAPTLDRLKDIAQRWGVPLQWLLSDDAEATVPVSGVAALGQPNVAQSAPLTAHDGAGFGVGSGAAQIAAAPTLSEALPVALEGLRQVPPSAHAELLDRLRMWVQYGGAADSARLAELVDPTTSNPQANPKQCAA